MTHTELLTLLGYTLTNHVDETWHDAGDAENGPRLVGGPAFDEWTRPGVPHAVVVVDGDVVAVEPDQPDFEPYPDDIPPTQLENTMTSTNTTPVLDLNAILGAAVQQIVTQATALLAARVDELERQASRHRDFIAANERLLNRLEVITAGHTEEVDALMQGVRRLEGIVDGTAPSDDKALRAYLDREIDKAVTEAMARHEEEYDHDEFGPAIDESELDERIERAIAQHERDTDHLDESDVERTVEDALDRHAADCEHLSVDDVQGAVRACLDDGALIDRVRESVRELAFRVVVE